MKISVDKKFRKAYKLVESSSCTYSLCKVLNEYDNKEEANKALSDLLTNSKTEKDLLKEYNKKDMF